MTNPNGELPPAPPVWTDEGRLERLEELVVASESGRLSRDVQALRADVIRLENDAYRLREGREAMYDTMAEVSTGLIRQQRIIARLESQLQAMLVGEKPEAGEESDEARRAGIGTRVRTPDLSEHGRL